MTVKGENVRVGVLKTVSGPKLQGTHDAAEPPRLRPTEARRGVFPIASTVIFACGERDVGLSAAWTTVDATHVVRAGTAARCIPRWQWRGQRRIIRATAISS